MGYRGCGGHQQQSIHNAKRTTKEAQERVEFPVVTLGSGNYAKLLERVGRVPRVVLLVHFEPGEAGERAAAEVIEGARGARNGLELVVWAPVAHALREALEAQATRLGEAVDTFLVGPIPEPPKERAKPWSKKRRAALEAHCKPLKVKLPTLDELEEREARGKVA